MPSVIGVFLVRACSSSSSHHLPAAHHICMCQLPLDDPSRTGTYANQALSRFEDGATLVHHVKLFLTGAYIVAELRHSLMAWMCKHAGAAWDGTFVDGRADRLRLAMDVLSMNTVPFETGFKAQRPPVQLSRADLRIHDAEVLVTDDDDDDSSSSSSSTSKDEYEEDGFVVFTSDEEEEEEVDDEEEGGSQEEEEEVKRASSSGDNSEDDEQDKKAAALKQEAKPSQATTAPVVNGNGNTGTTGTGIAAGADADAGAGAGAGTSGANANAGAATVTVRRSQRIAAIAATAAMRTKG